jgi:hypothetical protein
MGFSVTHSDGSVTRHDSYEGAVSAANASAARSGGAVQDTTSRASSGGGSSGSNGGSSGSNGSSANNVDRPLGSGGGSGGYTSFRDRFDGGGPGQSGDRFGGLLGGVSNALGFSPVASDTDRGSGAVYQGPTPGGAAGYRQDPGLMGVDTSTGFITSDANKFSPLAASGALSPNFDNLGQSSGDSVPVAPVVDPVDPSAPIGGTAEEDMGVYSPFLAGTATYAPVAGVSVVPGNDLLYEDYLARLMARNQLLQPLGITPLGGMPSGGMQMAGGISPLDQGIGSFAPPGFG